MAQMDIQSSVELLERCFGLSLSDQYWIKEVDSDIHWEDINFFNNDFSEDMGKLLMGQIDYSCDLDIFSPDNSSDKNPLMDESRVQAIVQQVHLRIEKISMLKKRIYDIKK